MMRWRLAGFGLLVGVAALATGCEEKLTFDRWSTLTLQSSKAEVETVLGKPNAWAKETEWKYYEPDKQINVKVEFAGGDVLTYSSWADPEHGMHEIGRAEIEGPDLIHKETGKRDFETP